MGQPNEIDATGPDPCPLCPRCQSPKTIVRLKTAYGRYCRCDTCAHVWHAEQQLPHATSTPRMASTETCPHCQGGVGPYNQKCGACGKGLSGAAVLASRHPLSMPAAERAGRSKGDAAKFFWVIAIIGAVLGGLQLFASMPTPNGAPQQAAGAAMGCAMAIVPYVIARAVEELTG